MSSISSSLPSASWRPLYARQYQRNGRRAYRLSYCVLVGAFVILYQSTNLTLPTVNRMALAVTIASDLVGCKNQTEMEPVVAKSMSASRHTEESAEDSRKESEGDERRIKTETVPRSKLIVVEPGQKSTKSHLKPLVIKKKSNKSKLPASTKSAAKCKPIKPVEWKWDRYSESTGQPLTKLFKARKRLLIGLYSGFDKYARMLDLTAHVNKAYGQRWQHDVVVLQGTHLILPVDGPCTPMGRRVTFNKVALLEYALNHTDRYDQLLLIDTDAMLWDLDADVTELLDDGSMLAAHRVHAVDDDERAWDVNAGVMLWNLRHPRTAPVANEWLDNARDALALDPSRGDQRQLHLALFDEDAVVAGLDEEFAYGHGTVIRHYIRVRGHMGWTDPNILETRLDNLEQARREVCNRYDASVCDSIPRTNYETE